MNELQHNDLTKQPIFEFSSFFSRSSTHTENRIGDKIPPCLTPEVMQKLLEILSSHLINEFNFPYQLIRISINIFGSFLSISLINNILKLILSKAFDKSREHMLTVEPMLLKYSTVFRKE